MSSSKFVHGGKGSIGQTAVQMTTSQARVDRAVQIFADPANSGVVYVGGSTVTPVTSGVFTEATVGIPVVAGEDIAVPFRRTDEIYLVAEMGTSNVVYFVAN